MEGPTDGSDPLGELDADDVRRTSGLIRHAHPLTQPDRDVIYIHNSVRPGNMFIVYPLNVSSTGRRLKRRP